MKSDNTRTPGTNLPGLYSRVGRKGTGHSSDKAFGGLVRLNTRNHIPAHRRSGAQACTGSAEPAKRATDRKRLGGRH